MLRASRILFLAHLRRTTLSKRALLCLLLVLAPVAAALFISSFAPEGEVPALQTLWVLQVQLVVPLASLLLGSAVVAEEIEDRTVTYLFTRPMPRAALLVGRWLAALVVLSVLLSASSWVVIQLMSVSGVADPRQAFDQETRSRLFQTILLGGAAYSLVFAVAGALLKHPVIVGLAYTFAIEGFFGSIPGSSQGITIMYHLKSFLAGGNETIRASMDEFTQSALLEPSQALTRLVVIMIVTLLLGGWVVTRKQYVLPS